MSAFLHVAAFVLGVAVIALALGSAIRVVVLPRQSSDWIGRLVFRSNYRLFTAVASRRATFDRRDRIMAWFAPVSLLLLPVAWYTVVLFGYMSLFWSMGVEQWRDAFSVSGSSMLTLGFTPVQGIPQTILAFTEALIGLGLIALLITYLPTMYSAFRQRENVVALLEVRAGSPPSGVEMLERLYLIGWTDHFGEMYLEWEDWFVGVEESHTSLPALVFFRSPHPDRSWITAAGAILDSAALVVSAVDMPSIPQAQVTIRAGYVALRRIADGFGIEYDHEPAATDHISIARVEFDEACDRLAAAGLPMKEDRDQAWRDFAGWRVNYDRPLLALCSLIMAPYAPWSSDRSIKDWRRPPAMVRWGRRLKSRATRS